MSNCKNLSNCKPNPGREIAEQITVIRSVLQTNGYRIRKQPRQAVWLVYDSQNRCYRLTYQPIPMRAWVLHPLDEQAQTLSQIIQDAVTQFLQTNTQQTMNSHELSLNPCLNSRLWTIVLLSDAAQRHTVARFQHRRDAEDHVRVMRRFVPNQTFEVVFDPPDEMAIDRIVE